MVHNAYIRDKGHKFEPIYVPNEIYSFYINFDKPITDENFSNFRLNIMNGDTLVSPNIGELKQDMISEFSYNIYCQFIFPFVPNGCYTFAITDIETGEIQCRSNCILVEKEMYAQNSVIFQYRHKRPISGFNYDNLPGFYNTFRLPLNKIDYQYDVEKKQYRNVSNKKLRNLYDYLYKYVKVESYYFDEQAHDAMAIAYQHDDILMNGTQYMTKDAYQVESNQLQSLNKGSVNLFEQERKNYPIVPDPNIYILSPDTDLALQDGDDNLITT